MGKSRKLVVGCGYLGYRVARRWRDQGAEVWVTTRRPSRATRLRADGFQVVVADVMDPDSLRFQTSVDTVLYAVGYDRGSEWSQQQVYVQGLGNVLAALPTSVDRFLYISSTGVYGQTDGLWVDEQSPCDPVRLGGKVCLEAEKALRAHAIGVRSLILRMAGLYGPERVPYLRDLLAGEPLRVPVSGYLNLIHIDDAAGAVLQAEQRSSLPETYVVADGVPVTRRAYYEQIAALVGVRPLFAPPQPHDPQTLRAASSKRVRNARLLNELQMELQYPSYREGLTQILGSWRGLSGPN